MLNGYRRMKRLKRWWCGLMHDDIRYPGGDEYWCGICLERWPVVWRREANAEGKGATADEGGGHDRADL